MVPRERRSEHVPTLDSLRRAPPRRADLVEIYVDALGVDAPDLEWFQALACFKSAATWSAIVKHNRRRAAPDRAIEEIVPALPRLLVRAEELARRSVLARAWWRPRSSSTPSRPGTVLLRLNRPERLNAINDVMVRELGAVCAAIESDADMRVVVLTGAGRGFCAGIDVRDFGPGMPDAPPRPSIASGSRR